jgi:hypothetical protein
VTARTDVYVRFTNEPVARGRRIGMLDQEVQLILDAQGRPVGMEILDAAAVEVNGAPVTPVLSRRPTLAETRTGLDWCPNCHDEAGTNRVRTAGGDHCATCATRLTEKEASRG